MSGRKTEGGSYVAGGKKKEQRGGEKDRMCWRKTRWKNTGVRGGDEWKFSKHFQLEKVM